jgi:AcrR family transcriptional regulator
MILIIGGTGGIRVAPCRGGALVSYRPPQQQRSKESLERILDAAESLIRERGFDSMTVAEVVQRSGSSVGSL